MTWVKGTTTWGALPAKLTELIVGDSADDSAVTVAAGDRWVREVTRSVTDGVTTSGSATLTSATASFTAADVGAVLIGAGIPTGTTISTYTNGTTVTMSANATASATGVSVKICTDLVKTPAAKNVNTGACSNRTGYFSQFPLSNGITASTPSQTVCRVTGPATSDPSTGGFNRWIVIILVNASNSVSGNYSTATIAYYIYDADSGAAIVSGAGLTLNSAGAGTLGTSGLPVSITDPSGFLTLNSRYVRAFTGTYMRGIDYWPMLYRAVSTPSFSAAPPGSAGTDYDIVYISHPPQTYGNFTADRSNLFHGLGIKTSTGLGSGALYTVSWDMALAKCRIFNSGTNGILALDFGQSKRDSANGLSTYRAIGGPRISTWLKMFQTAGSVVASSQVQYWMSVKSDGFCVVLNGDPGATGKLGIGWFGAFAPYDTTYDVFPIYCNFFIEDYTADNATMAHQYLVQYQYWAQRRRQDGSESPRDWQTKWMRADGVALAFQNGARSTDVNASGDVAPTPGSTGFARLIGIGANISPATSQDVYMPTRQNKPTPDGKWWLYGFELAEGSWDPTSAATVDESRFVRGTQNTRYWYIPETGWASGDELTDTATSAKYLLVVPDYAGPVGRARSASNTYWGGAAIAEV